MSDMSKMSDKTNGKIRTVCVVGPTASGKSALAVSLAKRLGGEVISCDSMQIYRGMDVGTAKITPSEARGIPHHLIDIVSPEESFSLSDYKEAANAVVDDLVIRGKLPIFCGGTGLYLDGVLSGETLSEAGRDGSLREELSKMSPDELYAELSAVDPSAAAATHKNNVKRVIRALEIYRLTGVTKTEWDRRSKEKESRYAPVMIGLDYRNRETLYRRIDKRVDIMLGLGLIDEVKRLDSPAFRASTASQAIGYKEVLEYLDGKATLEEAAEKIRRGSRNYAKRQLTWFRHREGITTLYPDDAPAGADASEFILDRALKIIG